MKIPILPCANEEYVILEKPQFDALMRSRTDEVFPADFVNRLFDSENKLRVWREYRGFSAQDLAQAAGISQAYLSEIETGKKEGSLKVWQRLSAVLDADLELLV